MDEMDLRVAIARVAKMMTRARLAEAFGHVSARLGNGFAITSTLPFSDTGPDDIIFVPDLAEPPSGGGGVPLETPMHAAIYDARPDVGAICRGHPPAVVSWGTGMRELPLLHGLGALAGTRVVVHDEVDLISTGDLAVGVAESLGADSSLILRGNGCLTVGETLLEALTRLFFLEERARLALGGPDRSSGVDWTNRLLHTAAEMPRAIAWIESTFNSEDAHS